MVLFADLESKMHKKYNLIDLKAEDIYSIFIPKRISASYGKTGQLLRVSGAAIPFRTVRSTTMLARSATGEVNTVIYLYPTC